MSRAREIHNKMSSVKSTQKITRAMELVAASKMRKAQDRMALSRPYATHIRDVISHVASSHSEFKHPYMEQRDEIKRVGFIVVSTDRGLCGGLNMNLFRSTLKQMKALSEQQIEIDVCLIGRKAESYFSRLGFNVVGAATGLGDTPAVTDLVGVVKVMLDRFDNQQLDQVFIVANEFINTMTQKPFVRELLPLQPEPSSKQGHWDYIYEPDDSSVLMTELLVRYIESQVYQAVIENIACEQSARMVAMKSATDNAGSLIDELRLVYNKVRQASITQEISEIVAGAAAVE
ncbi:MAG: F0F1 ATP synthase subunit gamma [Legionellales bacterium]|nr:F0F1 ATP synthase subunit gamma [Legionellales bacterium]HAG61958.1 F0F1 ATP synthase subunit gamma [Coxiellaceae bacterium]